MRKVLFILSELADSDLDWIVQHGVQRRHSAGDELIREGRALDELFILLDGRLSVRLEALQGREVAVLRSGEVLGELSFLDSRPPSASVFAVEDVRVLAIPRPSLQRKLEQDAAFAARFYRALGVFLAARLRKTQQSLGYGETAVERDRGQGRAEDELDPALLENVNLAGARFEWIMRRLREAPPAGEG